MGTDALLPMAALEEEFRRWRAGRGDTPTPVEFVRVEDEALVLTFSRSGSSAASVSIAAVEDAGFFVEGLEDPPDEVEDWLTDVNGHLSEKPKLSLGQAIDAMLARAPKALKLGVGAAVDSPMGGDDEEGLMEEEDDDDDQALLMADIEVEAAEDRSAQRAAQAEEERWDSVVASSAGQGSRQASQVLMREMRKLMALDGGGSSKAVEVEMVNDSLYRWCVKMHADGFPNDCSLRNELRRFGTEHSSGLAAIVMDVQFPDTYPMDPPFIRVVRPRFQFHTGHITLGGSVCMQLLTPSGWLPSVALETVFVAIRSEMVEGGGRVDFQNSKNDYTVAEAREAFNRVAERYGWKKS